MLNLGRRIPGSLALFSLAAALGSACGTSDSASGSWGAGGGPAYCGKFDPNGKGGILPPPDGPSLCPAGPCNYQTQNGCSETEACRPHYTASSTTVTPRCEAIGDGRSGDACATNVDCDRGYLCLDPNGSGATCHKQCCGGDWTACDTGESCIRQSYVQLADELVYAVDFCVPINTCDLFDPESCASEPGRECKIVDPTGAVACSPKSSAKLGDSCSPPAVCAQGLTCVGRAGTGQFCRRLCRAEACGQPSCPAAEGTCVHFDRNPPGVGECTLGR
jgi:hypothetical protein